MNQELFKKIHDRITPYPMLLHMSFWEGHNDDCGTTRCLAGWAIYETTGQSLRGPGRVLHKSLVSLAIERGLIESVEEASDDLIPDLAADLLGMERRDHWAFYCGEHIAVQFIARAAEGRFEEARVLEFEEDVD